MEREGKERRDMSKRLNIYKGGDNDNANDK